MKKPDKRRRAVRAQSKAAFAVHDLVETLDSAKEHLEYCGYGDNWEREGAFGSKLPERIESALARGKQFLENL